MPTYSSQCPICRMIFKDQVIASKGGICLIEWKCRLIAVNEDHAPLDLVGSYPIVAELFGFDFKSSVDKIFVSTEDVHGHGGVLLVQTIFN